MERIRISTGVSFIGKILKFVPIPVLLGGAFAIYSIPVPEARLIIFFVVSLFSAIFYFVGRRIARIVVVFYDHDSLYVESEAGNYQVGLKEIRALEESRVYVNDVPMWSVSFDADGPVKLQFMPQYTIWGKAFTDFLDELRKVNPAAIKSEYRRPF